MKRKLLIIIVISLIVGIGSFFWYRTKDQDGVSKISTINSYQIMTVGTNVLEKSILATGYIEPWQEKTMSAILGGEIKKIYVQEGQYVEIGELLLELDDSQQYLEYLAAESNYEQIKITGTEMQISQAKLNFEIAEKNLQKMKIKASIPGLIEEVFTEEGEYISASSNLVRIIDDTQYKVLVDIAESEHNQIKLDQDVIVTINALGDHTYLGKVVEISNIAEESNGLVTVPITVGLNEIDQKIKSNFSADLEIVIARSADKVVVPISAVFNLQQISLKTDELKQLGDINKLPQTKIGTSNRTKPERVNNSSTQNYRSQAEQDSTKTSVEDTEEYVIKIVDGKPIPYPVVTGLHNDFQVVIDKGLELGEQILINTYQYADASSTQESTKNDSPRFKMRP